MSILRRLILAAALMAGLSPVMAQVPPPVPGLPDTERRTSYSLTASTCACSLGFAIYGDSNDYQNWIEVFINGVQAAYNDPAVGWIISSPSNPSLATAARPITDAVLTFTSVQTGTVQIVGARRPRRVSQFNENTGVPARNLNQALTDMVAMLREDWDKINDVTGRAVLAPPGETIKILTAAANRANQGACFDSGGNLIPCVSIPTSTFSAGNGIQFTGTNPTVIKNNITANSPIVITGTNPLTIACPTCNTSPTPNFAYLPSRSNAITQNLSAFTVVQTAGYSAGGDGGGATFKNIGSSPFTDSFVLTLTITNNGGGSCTNGSYLGVKPTGGTGSNLIVNYTVSGNIVSAVAIAYGGGNAYSVGDVVSTTITGCSSTVTLTVATISTALGSFTDTAGTHWQIVVDAGNMVNIRQFGAVQNWLGSDGSATNDFASIQAAMFYASAVTSGTIDAGGAAGTTVFVPKGSSLLCGSSTPLMVPYEVKLRGQNHGSSILKVCDSGWSAATNIINICDPTVQLACFGSQISDLTIFEGVTPAANSNIAVIFSNNIQQSNVLQRVWIYSGNRTCINFNTGYGGAAQVDIDQVECTISNVNPGIIINYGTTAVNITNSNVEAGGSGVSATGVSILGGIVKIDTFHSEGISIGILVNVTTLAGGGANLMGLTGGVHCTALISLASTNTNNNTTVTYAYPNGCTNTVLDGQSGGTSVTTVITQPKAFNP